MTQDTERAVAQLAAAAAEVHRLGAQTGKQWLRLGTALTQFRIADALRAAAPEVAPAEPKQKTGDLSDRVWQILMRHHCGWPVRKEVTDEILAAAPPAQKMGAAQEAAQTLPSDGELEAWRSTADELLGDTWGVGRRAAQLLQNAYLFAREMKAAQKEPRQELPAAAPCVAAQEAQQAERNPHSVKLGKFWSGELSREYRADAAHPAPRQEPPAASDELFSGAVRDLEACSRAIASERSAPQDGSKAPAALAQVIEAGHDKLEARVRWLLNPCPVGTLLYEESAAPIREAQDAASQGVQRDGEAIERLRDAIEGECEGLAISQSTARVILEYVRTGRPPVQQAPEGPKP